MTNTSVKKYIALSLNPAVDRTMYFDRFSVGTLNRATETVVTAGSKGMNVARALVSLGADALSLSFAGGTAGEFLRAELAREGIPARFVDTVCGVRQNCKMIDALGVGTEANERGGPVKADELDALFAQAEALAAPGALFLLCGSLPSGVPDETYAVLIRALRARGAETVLDCDGAALRPAISAGPRLIKPNTRELEGLCGRQLPDRVAIATAAAALAREHGIDVLCTCGGEGSLLACPSGEVVSASAPSGVPVRGFAGAGDTYLAVYLWHRCSLGEPHPRAMTAAASAAAAKVASPGSSLPPADQLSRYESEITTETWGGTQETRLS